MRAVNSGVRVSPERGLIGRHSKFQAELHCALAGISATGTVRFRTGGTFAQPGQRFAAFFLLQPVKGTIVGLQWQTGMHGFEAARRRRDREARDGVAPLSNLASKEWVS